MKELLILRHGKSSWDDPDLPDHERPLNERGSRDAPRMGRFLRQQGLTPDLILSSTATRAESTALAVAETSAYERAIELSDELYLTDVAAHINAVRRIGAARKRALMVGHNPTLEGLIAALTGERVSMTTCALVRVELDVDDWRHIDMNASYRLAGDWRPKKLPKEKANDEQSAPPNPTRDDLQAVPGVGEITAQKLRRAGYESFARIAESTPDALGEAVNLNAGLAAKLVEFARTQSADDVDEQESIAEIDEDALLIGVAVADLLGKKARKRIAKAVGSDNKLRKALTKELKRVKKKG